MFANYAIEGRHRYNKQIIVSATNGFGHANSKHNIQHQQLTRSIREDRAAEQPTKKAKRKEQWSKRSLEKLPNLEEAFK